MGPEGVTVNDRHNSCFADADVTELAWPTDATVALALGLPAWPNAALSSDLSLRVHS
jgi:hypothetical protein